MGLFARLGIALGVGGALVVVAGACGTDAVGVEACRQIEEARCRKAPACPNIGLALPLHPDTNDVTACIRYYDDACQHGLVAADPGAPSVNACVSAINATSDCNVIEHPETTDACKWLVPPAQPDAGPEAEAGDAADGASDATTEATTD